MRVPTQEQSVGQEQIAAPNYKAPSLVAPGAFGGQVAEAVGELGKTIQGVGNTLGDYYIKKQQEKEHERAYDALSKYRVASQKAMFDNSPHELSLTDTDGKEQKFGTTKGWMLRNGYAAQTAYEEAVPELQKLKAQHSEGLSDYGKSIYNKLADTQYSQDIENILSYQGKELRKAGVNNRRTTIDGLVTNATISKTPEELDKNLKHIGEVYDEANRFDEDKFPLKDKSRFLAQALQKAATHTLLSTGDLQLAKASVDSVKEKIDPDDIDQIKLHLSTGFEAMRVRNDREARAERTVNRYKYLQEVFKDGINWQNIGQVQQLIGPSDPDLASALGRLVKSQGKFIPSGNVLQQMADMNTIKTMVSMDDPDKMSDYLVKWLNGKNSGNTSVDKLSMAISAVYMRHEELTNPKVEPKGLLQNILSFFGKANEAHADEMTGEYIKEKQKNPNASPEQLRNKVVRNVLQRNNPEIEGLAVIPNKVSNPGKPLKNIYSGTIPIQGYDDGDESDTTDQ